MSASTTKPKGHGHQVSVADAATLFGSAADDPFASILGSEPGLDGIGEEAEENGELAVEAAPPAAAVDDATLATPKAQTSALPEGTTESLEPPASNTATSSPSALFTSSTTMTDFFSGNHNDDWLDQNGETQYPENGATGDWSENHQGPQQVFDYHGEVNGAEAGMQYNHYQGKEMQYGEQHQPNNGYHDGTYQQQPQHQQEQHDQYGQPSGHYEAQSEQYDSFQQQPQVYDQSAGQYEQYSEQQQGYDPSAYGYGQQGYDESNGVYHQDSQLHAEQYNQYDPSLGQPNSYNEQQQYDPSANQYDPSANQQHTYDAISVLYNQGNQQHTYDATSALYSEDNQQQQHAYDPSSEQFDSYNQQQQTYDPALYGQGQEESLDSLGYPIYERPGQEGVHEEKTYPLYNSTAQEGQQPDLAGEFGQQEENQFAASYPSHDYAGQEGQAENGIEKHDAIYPLSQDASLSTHAAPIAAEGQVANAEVGPYTPSANDNYKTNPYTPSAQDNYGSSYTQEPFATDGTIQQHQDYADWSGANNGAEEGHNIDPYSETEGERGNALYLQNNGPSGYFDNVAMPPVLQTEDEGQYSRSLEATSPYDPRLASAGLSSLGAGAYMSQDRTLDAAEERHRAKIPLVSFSIDGKLLTFFPTWSQDASEDSYASRGGGYGMGGNSAPTKVTIRPLRSVVPANSYASNKNPLDFPGPALEGDTSQGSALSRATGASASTNKAKKTALIRYLQDAATDMASGISYLAAGKQASEARRTQDRILILRMLVLILEHDGNLVNNAAFDSAAKDLLLSDQDGAPPDDLTIIDLDRSPIPGPSADQKASFLNQIEDLLMAGQRKEAVDLAVREKMWTHAVVVASGMDRATWREVVGQFVENEFEQGAASHQGLKVAYHLFSGQEPKTTYDLFRRKTSLSSNNSTQSQDDEINVNLSQWRKSVATVLANRSNGDSATLTAIGDGLALSGCIEAAHICYLLSPQTSPMDGYDGGSTRLTLLGANSPEASTLFVRDLDHIILTEVFEYALSLQPIAKGAEAYHGLAYLQSYRLVHAYLLAEMGEVKRAIRYCDSIMTLLKHGKMNRYYHPVLLHQLQELSNRLQGDTKSTSWTKKKPTMDGVWSALEGRFTKFIAGEESIAKDNGRTAKGAAGPTVGPFSHYSAITPEARAGGMSRVHSTSDFRSSHPVALTTSRPQSRPGSSLSLHPIFPVNATARSVSEYGTGSYTPPGRDSALSSPKYGVGRDSSETDMYNGPFTTHSTAEAPWYGQESGVEDGQAHQPLQPVDTAYYGYEPHGASQPQFISNVDQDLSKAMGKASIDDQRESSSTPGPNSYQPQSREEEDDDDLGFGNKSSKSKANNENGNNEVNDKQSKEVSTPEKKKDGELRPAASWFGIGKFWGKGGTSEAGEAKAKKAHLGEEVSFYYDKDLKRWINKKAGDSGQAASPPPPPPRAQTVSPSSMGGNMPSNLADGGPRRIASEMRPPPTSSSSFNRTPPISEAGEDVSDYSPTKPSQAGRNRSNLTDHSQPPALVLQPGPPVRPSTSEGGPPRTASTSAMKKKAISKRYVRVD